MGSVIISEIDWTNRIVYLADYEKPLLEFVPERRDNVTIWTVLTLMLQGKL